MLGAPLGLALSLCWLPFALGSPGAVGTARGEPTLWVLADSNLRGAFGELAAVYNWSHRADVIFTFVTPATSGKRILGAAPINVFAGANPAQLEAVQRATGKVLGRPQVFGRSPRLPDRSVRRGSGVDARSGAGCRPGDRA